MKTKNRKRTKPKRTRRSHRNAGNGNEQTEFIISFEQIMNSIENTTTEYCGYVDNQEFILTDIGPEKTSPSQRGSCLPPNRPIIWHTHTIHSRYYPSFEDIHKGFKYANIRQSILYTIYGFWSMTYDVEPGILSDERTHFLMRMLGRFANSTNDGMDYDETSIRQLVFELNMFYDGFHISWHEYGDT